MKHIKYGILLFFLFVLASCNQAPSSQSDALEEPDSDALLDQSLESIQITSDELPYESLHLRMVNHAGAEIDEARWIVADKDTISERHEITIDGEKTIIITEEDIMTVYTEGGNIAARMPLSQEVNDKAEEPFKEMRTMLKENYSSEYIGEEDIAGRNTYHFVFKQNDNANIDTEMAEEMEIWFDVAYSIILRTEANGEILLDTTHAEEPIEDTDGLFELDLPDDVEIIDDK